jgi:hypothetical protein
MRKGLALPEIQEGRLNEKGGLLSEAASIETAARKSAA